MKRICSAFVCLAVFFSSIGVFADSIQIQGVESGIEFELQKPVGGYKHTQEQETQEPEILSMPRISLFSTSTPSKSIYQYLKEKLQAHTATFNLYEDGYICTKSELDYLLQEVCFNYDVLAYNDLDDNYSTIGSYIADYVPHYVFDSKADDEEAIEMMDEKIAEYVELTKNVPDLVGKILIIHDKFCEDNTYAYEAIADANNNLICYTAYGIFKNHRAVCQGNAIALKAIYEALNEELKMQSGSQEDIIENALCASRTIWHIWNMLKINGKWYYLDETWNEQDAYYKDGKFTVTQNGWNDENINTSPLYSMIGHDYFLMPLSEMTDHLKNETDSSDLWLYFPKSAKQECDDDDEYVSGYIFNQGFLSFKYDNGYIANYIRNSHNFHSKTIKSNGVLTTDIYEEENVKSIWTLVNKNVGETLNVYLLEYTDSGAISNVMNGKLTLEFGKIQRVILPSTTSKLLIFENNSIKPISEPAVLE